MPLEFPNWSWSQSEASVHLQLPVRGATAAKVDVVSTEQYLKVHCPPYLLEAFLSQPVDEAASRARVTHSGVFISLAKKSPGPWAHLLSAPGDPERLRAQALLSFQERLASEARRRAERAQADGRYALRTLMKLEEGERERIREVKDSERERTAAELQAWQPQGAGTAGKSQGKREKSRRSTGERSSSSLELPGPRASGSIRVTFTPRLFPTALRESRVAEEEEWLRRQAEARHVVGADAAELQDLQEPQRNPDWLKDKADNCFRRGDFLGAVSAYSLAIRLNPRAPALYSNRAACHLKLKNLHKAVEDSSQALDLLTPPVEANAAARARAHVRRGSAFCQLQLYAEGLLDYRAALRITPTDGALQADVHTISAMVQSCVDPAEELAAAGSPVTPPATG